MVLYASCLVVVLCGVYVILRVRREFESDDALSPFTVTGVWALYTAHAGLTVWAAVRSEWEIFPGPPLSTIAGAGLLVVGAVLLFGGIATLASFRRMSGMQTDELVSRGPYRLSRNPQNVGGGLMLLGVALLGQSGLALALAAFFWVLFRTYVPSEERYLERMLGEPYRRYRDRTPRFLGVPRGPA